MEREATLEQANVEGWSDEEIVDRVLAGETALFELIMRRYNQRLYRVARSILRDDAEAEDVMQDAYVRAYEHLSQFAGRAAFSTWLTRIAVYEALARAKKRGRFQELEDMVLPGREGDASFPSGAASPEEQVSAHETSKLLEEAVLGLPEEYRTVLVMRDVEEMTTAETAFALNLTQDNVKVRLHRARALLRKELYRRAGAKRLSAFSFGNERCNRVVERVFARINPAAVAPPESLKP